MSLTLASAPATEPIDLDAAKLHLKMDGIDDDDALIAAQVSAARALCEGSISQSFVSTGWLLKLDGWPRRRDGVILREIVLPRCPLLSVASVSYRDADDTLQVMSTSDYDVLTGKPGRVALKPAASWPIVDPERRDSVEIAFTAGYGSATAVPPNIKAAIMLMLAHLYVNREAVAAGSMSELPLAVSALLSASDHGRYS